MGNGFSNSFGQRYGNHQPSRSRRHKVSNKNVALWIGLALLYFFMMPAGVLVFIGLFYFRKIRVRLKWKQYLMPALGLLAISCFFYPQSYMYLRVTTFILFVLYLCGRFRFAMK